MRNFIMGLIIGIGITIAVGAISDTSYIGANSIWNKVFNSTDNTINVR